MSVRLLELLWQRIDAGPGDSSVPRDPDFIRRQLPAIGRYTSYFTPEVRGLDRLPADGPALLVGNHSGFVYVPEAWVCGQAVLSRRGIGPPAYLLAYDLLFAVPGVGPFLRQLGVIPADAGEAGSALSRGACVLVYPEATSRRAARGPSGTRLTSPAGPASCGSPYGPGFRSSPSSPTAPTTPSRC